MRTSKSWRTFTSAMMIATEGEQLDIVMSAAVKRSREIARYNDHPVDSSLAATIIQDVCRKSRDPMEQLRRIRKWNRASATEASEII